MRTVIIIVTALGLLAVAGPIVIGTMSFDGTVVDMPYERGLQWDREQKEREESGLQVQVSNVVVRSGSNGLVVSVTDREGKPASGLTMSLTVSRPSSRSFDKTYAMSPGSDGTYGATVDFPLGGIWDLKFAAVHHGREVLLERRIIAEESSASVQGRGDKQHQCDLNTGPCTTVVGGHRIVLDIMPRPIQAMRPLTFSVCLDTPLKAEQIVIDLTMPGMYMGSNRVVARKSGTSEYEGDGVITRCPSGRDLWEAAVEIPDAGRAVFEFHVAR